MSSLFKTVKPALRRLFCKFCTLFGDIYTLAKLSNFSFIYVNTFVKINID